MGVRNFVDSMSELVRIMQLRNYFTSEEQQEKSKTSINTDDKLKKGILKGKITMQPTRDNMNYLVYGDDVWKAREELKNIGATWNEEKTAVSISKDSYINNIDMQCKMKIESNIAEQQKNAINTIRQKILNKDFDLVSENGRYKIVGYTNDIKNTLDTLGFEKENMNFYIDKALFKDTFDNELSRLVEIYNNEYQETEQKQDTTEITEQQEENREKVKVEVCIVDMNNKGINKWIELPISRLNFSKLVNEFNSSNLKITKVKSNDLDIQKMFENKNLNADTNTIHKLNVLTRQINELSSEKLQEYKSVLKIEGLSKINDYVRCATELKTEQNMEIN